MTAEIVYITVDIRRERRALMVVWACAHIPWISLRQAVGIAQIICAVAAGFGLTATLRWKAKS